MARLNSLIKHGWLTPIVLALHLFISQRAVAGIWVTNTPLNLGRDSPITVLLPDGKVLVAGGLTMVGYSLRTIAEVEIYDPATRVWTTTNSMHAPRIWGTPTVLPNGKVLIAAGDNYNGVLANCELFDPTTGTWSVTGSMNMARIHHISVLLPNGKVLVAGGSGPGGNNNGGWIQSAECYDPDTEIWTTNNPMNTPRAWATGTLLPNGKVLVVGGWSSGDLSTAELFDPALGTWTYTGSLNIGRDLHGAVLLPNGKVLVAGSGESATSTSAELYDPSTGQWTMTGPMRVARSFSAMTLLPNGKVLVSGGEDGNRNAIPSAELYDPATGAWSDAGTLNTARWNHTSTLLPNGNVMLVGGDGLNAFSYDYLPDTEFYVASGLVIAPFSLGNPSRSAEGTFQFFFTNAPAVSFTAYGATDPSLPLEEWTVLNPAPLEISPGVYKFSDTQHTNTPDFFYRVRSP